MRNLKTLIDEILALIPAAPPQDVADDMTVLTAELRILRRAGSYSPPEALAQTPLWERLGTALYRYMPNPGAYPWAKQISDLVTAVTPIQ